jgi:DNA mismatch endonuclease Vsr
MVKNRLPVAMTSSRIQLQPIVWPSVTEATRRTMQGNKGKDTVPELALRSLIHSMGYRYRTHVRSLPGSPDVVFTARRRVVWLHGCFWHSHPGCKFVTKPRIRAEYWGPKLARNVRLSLPAKRRASGENQTLESTENRGFPSFQPVFEGTKC